MENPRNVIGTSNYGQNPNSYYNQQPEGYTNDVYNNNENDLYEYDADSSGNVITNASGRVKQLIGTIKGNNEGDTDTHSTSQYNRDVIETLCIQINQTLLIPKAFYFFFCCVRFIISIDGYLF